MNKLLTIVALLAGMAFASSQASAAGGGSPFCNNCQSGPSFGSFFFKQPMPAFQAAPWYSYWPYNSHFQTAAPLQGAYYAPPMGGGGMMNPYFPGGMYGNPYMPAR